MSRPYLPVGGYTTAMFRFFCETLRYNDVNILFRKGVVSHLSGTPSNLNDRELLLARRHIQKLLCCYLVDNFQTYLSDLLCLLFDAKKEVLSGKSLKAAWLFEEPDLESVKKRLVEKTILGLGYRGIDELNDYFNSNFGFKITDHPLTDLRLNRLVQIRNLITHRRGIVDKTFMFKVGAKADRLSEHVNLPNMKALDRWLISLASDVDGRAVKKFGLPEISYSEMCVISEEAGIDLPKETAHG